MDPVNRAAVTPSKSRLVRTFAKVLHIQSLTGISPVDAVQKTKKHDQGVQKSKKHDPLNLSSDQHKSFDEKEQREKAIEVFVAKIFASLSSVKASYAHIQFAQSPYDSDGIQVADEMVVSELKLLSEMKQCYVKNHFDESSPQTAQLLAEMKEQKSLARTFEIMMKKLDSERKLKDSELTFLREKLDEANKENKLLDKRLNSSGQLSSTLDNIHFSKLNPSHFIAVLRQTVKAIRSFVRLLIGELESAGWDVDAAANAIEPGVVFANARHKYFAFESFVCREMFDGFNYPYFSESRVCMPEKRTTQSEFFDRFIAMKSQKLKHHLAWKPKSTFARFCRNKYLRLIHPKMEESLFGNLNQRNSVGSGDYPDTTFFAMFYQMAKSVWLLHCLAYSFHPEVSIFQVNKRCRFSEVYMDCVNEEAFSSATVSSEYGTQVAFTVVPGFKIGKTVIQSQVYLC